MNLDKTNSQKVQPTVPGLKLARVGLWMTLAPVLLDYRTPEGTAWAVPLYTAILLVSLAGTAILMLRFSLVAWSQYRAVLAIATAFFLISVFSGIYWGNPLISVLRNAPSLLLYASGLLSMGALMASGLDPRLLWPTVLKAALVGIVMQVIVVQAVVGINFATIRYELLTGAAPLVSAFVVVALFFGGWNLWRSVMAVAHMALVMISVTRTHVVIFFALVVFLVVTARERILQVNRIGVAVLGALALTLTVVAVDAALPVSPIARWVERLTVGEVSHYGYDITEISRLGEARHQIELLRDSPRGMIFGFGAASPTGMDEESKAILRVILGQEQSEWVGSGIGHNSYIGIFFVGGLIGGGLLLLMQLWVFSRAVVITRLLSAAQYRFRNRLMLVAPVGYCAYMVMGTLAAPLGARSTAMMLAITTGFTLWMFSLLQTEINRQKQEAQQRRLRRYLTAG